MKKQPVVLILLLSLLSAVSGYSQYNHAFFVTHSQLANTHDVAEDGLGFYWATSNISGGRLVITDGGGNYVASVATINQPLAVKRSPSGEMYVTVNAGAGNSLEVYNPVTRTWVRTLAGKDNSTGLAFDANGNYYITDAGSDKVWAYAPNDALIGSWGSAQLTTPTGIAYNPVTGLLAVTDRGGADAVWFFTTGGTFTGNSIPATNPDGVACNEFGDMAVSQPHSVKIYDSALTLLQTIGGSSPGTGTTQFNRPWGMHFAAGQLWVAEFGNDRLHVFNGTPLPIELKSFDVTVKGSTATATAITASEVNNHWMVLEIAKNSLDFQEVARQSGAGNSTDENTYKFVLLDLAPGQYYARIRQEDFDGHFTYSPVRSFKIEGKSEVRLYPCPVVQDQNVVIDLGETVEATAKVYDDLGRMVLQIPEFQKTTSFSAVVAPGTYSVIITAGRRETVKRLVVVK